MTHRSSALLAEGYALNLCSRCCNIILARIDAGVGSCAMRGSAGRSLTLHHLIKARLGWSHTDRGKRRKTAFG